MKDVNKVILMGRLGSDPKRRETKTGLSVVNFPLATSRRLKAEPGSTKNYDEETQWHRIVVWGRKGENCAQYLKKGSAVYIEGSMRNHQYDGKDGVKHYSSEVYADDVSFLNRREWVNSQSVDSSAAEDLL